MAGRPSKYNKEIQAKADDYLNNHKNHDDTVPSTAGLAYLLKVNKQTLYNWSKEHKIFLDTLEAIQGKQEKMLLSNGLENKYNAQITKLMLGNHGYHEKKDVDHSGEIVNKTIDLTKLTKQELEDLEKLTAKLES